MSPPNQPVAAEAAGRPLDPAVSLALHRAASDLAQTATLYDLDRDGILLLDRLAGVCSALDGIAVEVWRDALSPRTSDPGCAEDRLEGLRDELYAIVDAFGEPRDGQPRDRPARCTRPARHDTMSRRTT